ncbi:MAG: universal stress protein [Flavobacteriales bacterium]
MEQERRPHQHIFHPTDLSLSSKTAFQHAVAMAWSLGTKLTIMHVAGSDQVLREELPSVRSTLSTWGWTSPGREEEDLRSRGMAVRKILSRDRDPISACAHHLTRHPADLVVLHTHRHEGRVRWQERSVGEEIRRSTALPVLFFPEDCAGWLDPATGDGRAFKRVVLAVERPEDSEPLLKGLMAVPLNVSDPSIINMVHIRTATRAGSWGTGRPHVLQLIGPVVDTLVEAGRDADLLVFGTRRPKGPFDALRGTTTEQVLRRCSCPLLALPLGASGGQ